MKRRLLIILLALMVASLGCSLFTRSISTPPTPDKSLELPPDAATATPKPTRTPRARVTATPQAAACPTFPAPVCDPAVTGQPQPVEVFGRFSYSNDIIATYYVEQAVALNDIYGFIIRDHEWELPVESQTLGFLELDTTSRTGEFWLQLPARPLGTQADVNPNGQDEAGVQVFAVAYSPNLTGGPYSEGDDPSLGWPSYLASTQNDPENEDEVIGGKLIIWSPDAEQFFPSGFGDDGLLFTEDDPVQPVPAGYSVIDLDASPFAIIRDPRVELTLYEPADVAIKDYSGLSYSEAFERMFEVVRKEYAFNGIEGKQPDWDALYDEIAPRIKEAEQEQDAEAFALALRDFTEAFKDGHVGLSGDVISSLYARDTAGGYGFAIRELDDGRVISVFVSQDGPAARAGMKVGAEIIEFNGLPVAEAIAQVKPWTGPFSTDFGRRYEQARFLTRAPLGTETTVVFKNRGESQRNARLQAVDEQDSLFYTSPYRGMNPYGLPVEYELFPNDVGYVRITSNYDDLNLIMRLFERALKIFTENGVTGLIIDMRQNSGGANLGLAGFLHDQEILMGQLEYYSDKTGQFEPEGPRRKVLPNETQYRFDRMVLIVGLACASACELESYGFSQVPGMEVVGQFPTAGVEAEVARGQFEMPEGISMQIPTGRFTLPDGSLFLEGVGVQPTVRVPITEETVLSERDPVLQEAYDQVVR